MCVSVKTPSFLQKCSFNMLMPGEERFDGHCNKVEKYLHISASAISQNEVGNINIFRFRKIQYCVSILSTKSESKQKHGEQKTQYKGEWGLFSHHSCAVCNGS